MKRIFAITAALLFTLLLAACGKPAKEEKVTFAAAIEEFGERSLLVLADEDASVRNSSDRFWVGLSKAKLLDEAGKEIDLFDFRMLDRVEITFNGNIDETYPAQIGAETVVRLPKEPLTLDRVRELAEKGQDLTWTDFAPYQGQETGSGLYIMYYELEDDCFLTVGGVPGEKPMYIRLCRGGPFQSDFIDIREDSIQDFLDGKIIPIPQEAWRGDEGDPDESQGETAVAGGGDYPAAIQAEGKIYLLRQAIPAEIDDSAIIGRTTSYTDGWPQQDGETNFSRELDLPYARVEDGIAVLYEHEWHFCDEMK